MIEKRLFTHCRLLLVLVLMLPTLARALDEPAKAPPLQTDAAIPTPAKPAPVQATTAPNAPVQSVPAPISPAKPAPATPVPVKPVPAKPAPATPVPVKPVPAKPAPATPVPAKPAPVKPAPATALPAKPVIVAPAQTANIAATPESASSTPPHSIDIEFFIRDNCQQCDKAKVFLSKLQSLQPQITLATRDVRKEPAALELLKRMAQNQGGATLDYPAFVVGGQLIIGFTEEANTAQSILDLLATSHPSTDQESTDATSCTTGKELGCELIPPAPSPKEENAIINLFGYSVPLIQIGLPLFTLAMGLLDGFNFGSTWVLVLMLSLLAPMKNRSLMLGLAGTFIAVQGIIYFIWMAAWLNLFLIHEVSQIPQFVFAGIASLAAILYFKRYLQFGHRISISSHEIEKPGIYTRIRKIAQAEILLNALLGTILLAILVQLGEFTYKSFFPALYTKILTLQQLDSLSNYGYLLLYDFAYMLDDLIVMIIGIATLKQSRTQETEGRAIQFISALAMAGVAMYLWRLWY